MIGKLWQGHNLKKAVLSSLVFCLFLSAIAGCSAKEKTQAKKTLTIWHWMTDREPAFQELAKRYEEKAGVKINFELYAPSDAYAQKVRAAAQGVNLPDIFSVLGEKYDFSAFIKAGHISDLSAYMKENNQEWERRFYAKALAVNEFTEGNTYKVQPNLRRADRHNDHNDAL